MIDKIEKLEDLKEVLDSVRESDTLSLILIGSDGFKSYVGTNGSPNSIFESVVSVLLQNPNIAGILRAAITYIDDAEVNAVAEAVKGQIPS